MQRYPMTSTDAVDDDVKQRNYRVVAATVADGRFVAKQPLVDARPQPIAGVGPYRPGSAVLNKEAHNGHWNQHSAHRRRRRAHLRSRAGGRGIDLDTVGIVPMIVGTLGLVVSMLFWSSWGRTVANDARPSFANARFSKGTPEGTASGGALPALAPTPMVDG